MLMKADIMLLDEPTNHLDVKNVAWLEDYLTHLPDVTSMVVSHDSGFLDHVCTGIIHYENRKLKHYRVCYCSAQPCVLAFCLNHPLPTLRAEALPGVFLHCATSQQQALLHGYQYCFTNLPMLQCPVPVFKYHLTLCW